MSRDAKYVVRLTPGQRACLESLAQGAGTSDDRRLRAQILLRADAGEGGPGRTDMQIAYYLGVAITTVHRARERFVLEGLEAALARKPSRQLRPVKLDGDGLARLLALTREDPPEGHTSWTLQRLADRLVELGVVDRISDETVRRPLRRAGQGPAGNG